MSAMHKDAIPAPWRRLGETLEGHFTARAHGLLASDFALLDREGNEIGRLSIDGPEAAELRTADVKAHIERLARNRYRMPSGGLEILTSTEVPGSPRITCLGRPYNVKLSLLRNTAAAGPAGDETTARVAGGLTNRRYEITFDARDEGSLPVALFLLYRLVDLRRAAYRAG